MKLFGVFVLSLLLTLANASRVPKPARKKAVARKPLKAANTNTNNTTAQVDAHKPGRGTIIEKIRSAEPKLKTVKVAKVDPNTPWYLQVDEDKENRRNLYQATYFERPQNLALRKSPQLHDSDIIVSVSDSEEEEDSEGDSDGNDKGNKNPNKKREIKGKQADDKDNKNQDKKPKVQELKDKCDSDSDDNKNQVKKPKVQEGDADENNQKPEMKESDSSSSSEESKDDRWWMSNKDIVQCDTKPFAEGTYGKAYRATFKGNLKVVIKISTVIGDSHKAQYRRSVAENEIAHLKHFNCKWITKYIFDQSMETKDSIDYLICMEDGGISLEALYLANSPGNIKNDNKSRVNRGQYFAVFIIKALLVCHESRILHGDVSPKNVLVNQNGDVKLCDFGGAVVLDDDNKIMEVCGTPPYMSYNALCMDEEHRFGVEADYYSVGAVMFAIDQLREPLDNAELEDILEWHEKGGELWETMSKDTDQEIYYAVMRLCNGVNDSTVKQMSLFRTKLKQRNPHVPQSVLGDIAVYMEKN